MPPPSHAGGGNALPALRIQHGKDYVPVADSDEDVVQPSVSEGELRARLSDGATVAACLVVVARNQLRGSVEFVPFFRLRPGDGDPLGIKLYRGKGLRAWSDFRKFLDFLRDPLGFAGPVIVVERSDPLLADWSITLPGD